MEIHGEIGILESARACAPLRGRLLGWRAHIVWIYLPLLLAAEFAGSWLGDHIVRGAGLIGIVLVAVLGFVTYLRLNNSVLLNAWRRRGVLDQTPVTYRIEENGLVIVQPTIEIRLLWDGLTEIARGHKAWLFIGKGNAHFLPDRLFLFDAAAHRAFLATCLDRIPPEAKARSAEAARFAASA